MTQSKKYIQPSGAVLAISIGFILLMSTAAMLPSQAAVTPTLETTATSTEQPTSTPTATQTSTSTPTPSATPTYSVPEPLQTEIANVNEKLDGLKENPWSTHSASIVDNLVAEGILWVLGLFIGKKAVKVKIDQDNLAGKAVNKTLEDINIVLGYLLKVSFWLLMVLIIVWAIFTFGQPLAQSASQLNLQSTSLNSNRTETQSNGTPQSTSTPSGVPEKEVELQNSLYFSFGLSLVIILVFFSITGIIEKNQIKKYESTFQKLDLDIAGRKLLPAIFLVLILNILPNPIEAFLSPIIIPYILFAFFDVVLLYSNSHLQDIVVRHYPKIIFLSVFGVWFRVFQLLQDYLRPILNVIWQQFSYSSVRFLWELLPITLAILYSIIPSRRISKISEELYIRKMRKVGEHGDE